MDTVRGTPNIGIQLSTTTNLGAITDTLLPTEPPLLSEFDIRSFTINGNGSQRELEIHGLITSFVLGPLPQEVPEPSTLALFATGLAGLGFMMRRRRRSMQLKAA